MTQQAYVLTQWIGDGLSTATAFRPAIGDTYPLLNYQDVTAQPGTVIPPTPNLFVALCTVDDATAALVAADNTYRFMTVDQWNNVPTATAFNNFCNWLVNKAGRTLAQVQSVVGSTVNGRTWGQILTALIQWLQTRPHG